MQCASTIVRPTHGSRIALRSRTRRFRSDVRNNDGVPPNASHIPLCHVDKKSLQDLGILPNSSGEWPLRKLLDHTHSRTAARVLENLLANPLSSRTEILARQQLLRELPAVTQHLNWKQLDDLIRALHTYLDSNFIVFPQTSFEATVFALQYRNIVKFVETQIVLAAEFLEVCATVHEQLNALGGDSRFRTSLNAFDTIFTTSLRTELRVALDSPSNRRLNICRLDARFRIDLREQLLLLVAAIHEIDAFCSLATSASAAGLIFPTIAIDRHDAFVLEGLRHPLVKNAESNTIALQPDERVMFVTGPNMAGKSTLLRTLGIVTVFAHIGLPVPATRATIPLVDRVIASLGNEDNILRAESLYLAEVRRVKSVVAAVAGGEQVVALLDEVFRGTNVKDASDATALLITGLAHATGGLFAVSSHLVEVAETHAGHPGIGFWHLEVESHADQFIFTYRLARGISHLRLGMALLKAEGVADLLAQIQQSRLALS